MKSIIKVCFFSLLLLISCRKEKKDTENTIPNSININTQTLVFDNDINRMQINFSNITEDPLNWELKSNDAFFVFNSDEGMIAPNEIREIDIYLNRDLLNLDSLKSQIQLISSKGDEHQIPIQIYHQKENKIKLPFRIEAASYCSQLDRIYIKPKSTSKQNYELYCYDIDQMVLDSISLSFYYKTIQVSPDQEYLLLFSSNHLHILDINTYEELYSIHVSTTIKSVIKKGNLLYTFPLSNNDYDYMVHDLSDGSYFYMLMYGINHSSNFIAKMNRSGTAIYAFNDNYYDKNLVKLDISGIGHPQIEYSEILEKIRHRIFLMDWDQKLFSYTNTYYEIDSTAEGFDLTAQTFNLQGKDEIELLTYSSNRKEYYMKLHSYATSPVSKAYIYSNHLDYKGRVESEDFTFINTHYNSISYDYYKGEISYIFFSHKKNALLLLTTPYPKISKHISALEIIEMD